MCTATQDARPVPFRAEIKPSYIFDASFEEPDAEKVYGVPPADGESSAPFMEDEITRAYTKNMHYAAWRVDNATKQREEIFWRGRYFDYRDRIVLGNRKLTYRAVHRWAPAPQFIDDMASECQIVLIKATAVFNPWLGIRFSTYACTCLMRALSRLSHRQAADQLSQSLPLDSLLQGEPWTAAEHKPHAPALAGLYEYLRHEHPLLTPREKLVIVQRFQLNDAAPKKKSLEDVGRELGLSKERVRQVQVSALGKLRTVLAGAPE